MKIDVVKERDNMLGSMTIIALCATEDYKGIVKPQEDVEVILTINGHEVNLEAFIKRWDAAVDAEIESKVSEAVGEFIIDKTEPIDEAVEKIKKVLASVINTRIKKPLGG